MRRPTAIEVALGVAILAVLALATLANWFFYVRFVPWLQRALP